MAEITKCPHESKLSKKWRVLILAHIISAHMNVSIAMQIITMRLFIKITQHTIQNHLYFSELSVQMTVFMKEKH